MKLLTIVISSLFLLSCKATEPVSGKSYADLSVQDDEMTRSKWQALQRFPPRYPTKEAFAGREGCATIAYVITPNNQVTDMTVVNATNANFAVEAKKNIKNWRWSAVPDNVISKPVKTQTRFEYCLEDGDGHCSAASLAQKSECSGSDVLAAIGMKVSG